MTDDAKARTVLLAALLAYAAASLLHHIHNAEFLAEYPNLPAGLSRTKVYLAWIGEAALGVLGYLLVRHGYRPVGLALVVLYALLGFGGLAHYTLAPFSAHTAGMNLTIGLEVAAAALLLAVAAVQLIANKGRAT